ncbi:MAG TPA: ATP-binding protein [Burkholderiaceae bacterium]|nr:ATP-binding protein [Burkholderiaceae bacterium]
MRTAAATKATTGRNARSPYRGRALRLAIGIGAIYAAAGIAWIIASDALVSRISTEPAWLAAAQRFKGIFFVLATSAGLVALVRSGYVRLLAAIEDVQSRELQVQDLFLRHPQPMWVIDAESQAFLKVNEAAVRRYGYAEAEFLRMRLDDIRATDPEATRRPARPQPPEAIADIAVERHRKRLGEKIHVRVMSNALTLEGRPAVMAMAIDVTQEVLSRHALERQEAQFRQLHQSLGEVLWLASADEREIIYVSPAFEGVYGRRAEEFERDASLWLEAIHPEDRDAATASRNVLKAAGHSSCEYRIIRPDGSVRWVADRKKLIVDADGFVTMVGVIVEDITAAKERDVARATTQAELQAMVAERTAALQRANDELDAFARTAAHDLRAPLNAIAGFSQILQIKHRDALGDDGSRMVMQIERSAMQMAELVNDLLGLSRLTTAEMSIADVDLAPLVREIVGDLRQQQPERRVDIDMPDVLVLRCDAGLARSLLANVIGNAWKFSGKRELARIRIGADATPGGTEVSIEDNGSGFSVDDPSRLFKPFERFHPASEFGGTGIGLVTCRRIVERHGGRIRIESTPGHGTIVRFTLAPPNRLLAASGTSRLDREPHDRPGANRR